MEKEVSIAPEGFWGPRYEGLADVRQIGPAEFEIIGTSTLTRYYPWWKRLVKFLFRR